MLDDEGLSQFLGMSRIHFDHYKKDKLHLPLNCVVELAEKVNVHIEDLLSSDFRLNSSFVNSVFQFHLDQKYNFAKHSRTRPIANILDYLDHFVHPRMRLNILRKFQLSEEFINNAHSEVNMFLILDILKYLKEDFALSSDHFFKIGQRTPFLPQNKGLIQILKQFDSPGESLAYFIEVLTKQFDTNFSYEV